TPLGCDGIDNDNNGFVDDYNEGTSNPVMSAGSNAEAFSRVQTFVANHRHKTARSEMLYAILVNGKGPLGSSFTPEDFSANEVKDTEGDGVPEFVDAWGEPLQFYRWPIYHTSPIQKGFSPLPPYGGTTDPYSEPPPFMSTVDGMYTGPLETRQLNPLDQ